ncbi:radical SAM protein [Roseobacteraceae bacterium S113]
MDVVGTCNLRCPTCPVGNSPLGARKLGFMPYALFEEIVAKIARETPAPHPQINLFNWGEPLLHPDLPKMIALLKRHGFASHLSSNLNIKRGLREVIAADPDDLKISISGFSPETYDKTHKRGNLELVQKNMRALRRYLDETGARTRIWVGQHIYKSNQHESAATRAFALELGFEYAPIPAFYMPLERVVDHIEGRETPANDGILDDLLEAPHARLDGPDAPDPAYDCELRFNQTVINYDGSVALCCSVYDTPQMLGVQYLDESFAALEARKYAHSYCGTCQGYGLQFAPRAPMILPDGLPPNEARDAASL